MIRTAVLLGLVTMAAGCGNKLNKVQAYERDHYSALVVWFEDEKRETRAWLKGDTPDERDQWLKDNGYWDRFYQYDEATRREILGREPKPGWSQDMVYMAWGPPHRKVRAVKRTASETLVLTYLLQVTPDGEHLIYKPGSKATYKAARRYTQEVVLDDRVVSELRQKEGWP